MSQYGMRRIQQYSQEIKTYADEALAAWGMLGLMVVAIVGAFGLGRLSATMDAKPLVTVSEAAAAAATTEPLRLGGYVVASRSGEVYYFPWCAGASNITAQNQRWFESEAAAEQAGYRPAKNCRGLTD